MKFKNKTVFISGVNRGLGKSIFEKFLKEGADIICTVRKKNKTFSDYLKNLKSNYRNKIQVLYLDFENRDKLVLGLNKIKKNTIIDILINNAGYASGSILEMTKIDEIEKNFQINFFAHIQIIQKLLPNLKKSEDPSIINVGSISSFLNHKGTIAYGSSKASIAFATKVMANEFRRYKIRVNAIAPSAINTDMLKKMDNKSKIRLLKDTNIKKPHSVKTIVNKIILLSSSKLNHINGKIIKNF